MNFLLITIYALLPMSIIFLYMDRSSKIFGDQELYRKQRHRHLFAPPQRELRYQIQTNQNSEIVEILQKYLRYRRLGYAGLLLLLINGILAQG